MSKDPAILTDEELDAAAAFIPLMKAWASAVEKELLTRLQGFPAPQFQYAELKPKIGNRQWVGEKPPLVVLRKLGKLDVVAPRVVISPTQAEKAFGKKVYEDYLAKFVDRPNNGFALSLVKQKTEKD